MLYYTSYIRLNKEQLTTPPYVEELNIFFQRVLIISYWTYEKSIIDSYIRKSI